MLLVKNRLDQFVAPAGPPDEKYTLETSFSMQIRSWNDSKKKKNKEKQRKYLKIFSASGRDFDENKGGGFLIKIPLIR